MKVGKGMFRAMRGTVRAAAWFDSMNWYAVQTKPRQEAIVQTSLAREGVETFLPKLRQRRTIRRVRRWVTSPLFLHDLSARCPLAGVTSPLFLNYLFAPVDPV